MHIPQTDIEHAVQAGVEQDGWEPPVSWVLVDMLFVQHKKCKKGDDINNEAEGETAHKQHYIV